MEGKWGGWDEDGKACSLCPSKDDTTGRDTYTPEETPRGTQLGIGLVACRICHLTLDNPRMEITQRDWTPTGIAHNFPILLHPPPISRPFGQYCQSSLTTRPQQQVWGGAPWELNGAKPSPTGYELLKTVLWALQCPYREGDQEGPRSFQQITFFPSAHLWGVRWGSSVFEDPRKVGIKTDSCK